MEKLILMFVLGVIFGFVFKALLSRHREMSGIMHIDQSDPEKDIYALEVTVPMDDLPKKKVLYFKVDTSSRLSQ